MFLQTKLLDAVPQREFPLRAQAISLRVSWEQLLAGFHSVLQEYHFVIYGNQAHNIDCVFNILLAYEITSLWRHVGTGPLQHAIPTQCPCCKGRAWSVFPPKPQPRQL